MHTLNYPEKQPVTSETPKATRVEWPNDQGVLPGGKQEEDRQSITQPATFSLNFSVRVSVGFSVRVTSHKHSNS